MSLQWWGIDGKIDKVSKIIFFQTFGIVTKIILRTLSVSHQHPTILGSFRAEKND